MNVGTHRSEFTYDGGHRRTRIVEKENGVTVRDAQLLWADDEIVDERLATRDVSRYFQDGEDHNGSARYLTRDHLNSVREVTNSAGTLITRNEYDAFGELTRVYGTSDSRFGYTGHMSHAPTGLALALFTGGDRVRIPPSPPFTAPASRLDPLCLSERTLRKT